MDKEAFFLIVAVVGACLFTGMVLAYLWPVIHFVIRCRRRHKSKKETWCKTAMDLYDEIEVFTQQSSVRAFVFEPLLQCMMLQLFREGYLKTSEKEP